MPRKYPKGYIKRLRPGKPEHEPNDVYRHLVTLGIACRMTHEAIAATIGISDRTLRKHYQKEISGGKAMIDIFVADSFLKAIGKGDSALIKYYMNNQMGFKEKTEVDVKHPESFESLAIPEYNRWLERVAARPRTIDHAPSVPNELVFSSDGSLGAAGHEQAVDIPAVHGSSEQP